MFINDVTGAIVDAAITVHSELGPGLLETTYEACLVHELNLRNIKTENQLVLPVVYKQTQIDTGYRIDLLVESKVIVELKAVEKLLPIHSAQLLTYLRLSKKSVGLLINFNTLRLKHGIKRIAN